MVRLVYSFLFILLTLYAHAQSASNIKVEQEGEQVLITYDLDKDVDFITLQLSMDGAMFMNIKASGEVGKNIKFGFGKKIIYKPPTPFFCGSCVFRIKIDQIPRFVDPRDGQIYKLVTIGNQIWMVENLNYVTSSGSWCYDDNPENCKQYGRLYNWETAKSVCPVGWQLPSDAEWSNLISFLGGESVAGGKMKSMGLQSWKSPNNNATNTSGFSGLPGGSRNYDGIFSDVGKYGYWWSSTEHLKINGWYSTLGYDNGVIYRNHNNISDAFSVRCLKLEKAEIVDAPIKEETGFLDPSMEAQFNGDWKSYLQKTIERYIGELTDDGHYGTCEVLFVVSEDGTISNVEVRTMKGTVLARVAVDAIKKGPKWKPGTNLLGQPVASKRIQKIQFVMPKQKSDDQVENR